MPTKYQVSVNKYSAVYLKPVMTSKPVVLWVPITELPTYVGGAKIKTDSLRSHTRTNVGDLTAGATGAIMVASDFSDTLTLF